MSDAEVDAAITARRLLVYLLRAQSSTPCHRETAEDVEGLRTATPSNKDQVDRPTSSNVVNPLLSKTSSEPVPCCRAPSQHLQKTTQAELENKKRKWWQLRRRLSSGAAGSASRSSPPPTRHKATSDYAEETAERYVRQWRANLHAALRLRSAYVEERLHSLLTLHIKTSLAAALGPVVASPPSCVPAIAAGGMMCSAAVTPLPRVVPAGASLHFAAVSGENNKTPLRKEETSALLPAITSFSVSCDLTAPLRVVSTGYAATVAAAAAATTAGVHHDIAKQDCHTTNKDRTKAPRLSSETVECAGPASRGHTTRQKRWTMSSGHREGHLPSAPPPTLRSRLQRSFVVSAAGAAEGVALVVMARARLDPLLVELNRVQRTGLSPTHCPPVPTATLSLLPKEGIQRDSVVGAPAARCTVWEGLPVRMYSLHEAPLCAQQEGEGPTRAGGTSWTSRALNTSARPFARLKAAWRRHRRGHSSCNNTNPDGVGSGAEGPESVGDGASLSPSPSSPPHTNRRRYSVGDPLCAMSDGEWAVLHEGIDAVQQLQQRFAAVRAQSTSEGRVDPDPVHALTAFSPLVSPPAVPGVRERVVVSYAAPPTSLDAIHWAEVQTPPADESGAVALPPLRLHTAWTLTVEVESAHAAWLRRVLLDVASTPSYTETKAGGDGAAVAVAQERLRADIVAAMDALRSLSV